VIIANAIIIGCETDYGGDHFVIAENVFNAIFLVEMLIRVSQLGGDYFKDVWYLFDFTLVCGGVLDLWIVPFVVPQNKGHVGHQFQALRLLRILRLCRVLRVVRLFRMFNNLLLIVKALGKALQVVLLISLIVVIIMYAMAIVLTQLIGHNKEQFPEDRQEDVKKWFGTIVQSMTTMFWIMFGCGWDPLLELLSHVYPTYLILCAFAAYMVITVALGSLVVGLICQSLVIAQEEFKTRKLQSFANKKKVLAAEYTEELVALFDDEVAETGAVSGDSLKSNLKGDANLISKLATVGVGLTPEGLASLVDSLSNEDEELVKIEHFVEKLINLTGPSQAAAIVDIKYDILKNRSYIDVFEQKVKDLEKISLAKIRENEKNKPKQ
jgi:hypothetical protein